MTLLFFRIGYACPIHFNPADFYIHTLAVTAGKEDQCKDKIEVLSLYYKSIIYFKRLGNLMYHIIPKKIIPFSQFKL